jgi:hypothetical protein
MSVIIGHAYGRRATLEVTDETLVWRAQRGVDRVAENIATTVHDVRGARWVELVWSRGGAALCGLGALWAASEGVIAGLATIAAGVALVAWRRLHPRRFLLLEVGDRRLVLHVAADSAPGARALVERITRTLASGEPPRATPTLP